MSSASDSVLLSASSPFLANASAPFLRHHEVLLLSGLQGVCAVCCFDHQAFQQQDFQRLGVGFPAGLQRAVNTRQADYLAGRYASRLALSALGRDAEPVGMSTLNGRQLPVWPQSLLGSISHSGGVALCALSTEASILGIDIEAPLAADDADAIAALKSVVANRDEIACLQAAGLAEHWGLSLLFSAKESLFKALYPQVQQFFDFSAAHLRHLCPEQQLLTLVLNVDLGAGFSSGREFNVRWQQYEGQILSYLFEL